MSKPALKPVPGGMHTITTHLWFNGDCAEACDFYQKAFGAELAAPIVHGPEGNATSGMFVYVSDCDKLFQRALDAGCEVIFPMNDMFWGDRMGKVKDPYGHCWAIASHKTDYTPEEIESGQAEWLESMGS